MFFSSLILFLALFIDRIIGDPHTRLHPVALIGLFIGWWGRPDIYPLKFQRGVGLLMWVVTASLFTIPFLLFTWLSPWYLYLAGAPFLLKACFALRSLEEHAGNVTSSLDLHEGREKVQMLVSRNTGDLTEEQVLSAAYESVAENLNDSIIAPLFYFAIFGLPGAALYRAANTMDAMLGYRDERLWIGWFPARMDDILSYIPARITGLLLLVYFGYKGRIRQAISVFRSDRKNRPGFNGGIPMSLIAGGIGVMFEKPGYYRIGFPERSLRESGREIIQSVRFTTLLFVCIAASVLVL